MTGSMPSKPPLILPRVGERWRHYKGNSYTIDAIRLDENERVVVCYGDVWCRSIEDFCAMVGDVRRFELEAL